MYGNDVRRTLILGQYGTAVRSERNCSENTNVYGVRPITTNSSIKVIELERRSATAFSAGNGFVKKPKLGFLALNDKNSKYINLHGCYRY